MSDRTDKMRTEQAIEYLSGDPLLHMDMLESIRRGNAQLLQATAQGVLLYHTACGALMMSTEKETAAGRMIAAAPDAAMFVAHQHFYIPAVQDKFPFTGKLVCRQAVYPGRAPLAETHASADIRPLDERYLSFLMEHYSHADDEEYHRERLRSGAMFGAFRDRTLTGFIGIHSEGSIGMLEVLPEYRHHGIASILESFLVNRLLTEGNVPFAQIVVGNEASLALHRKLHFSISERTLCWLTK